ncbi:MAG: ABC transporter permease [Anaerolineaceae bacterium]|nr:ABC transporter permease [Anaerolineaceae bacterium]MBN2678066.1 ABC transporter permease [Anaerolineaceae bacterium]
MKFLSMLRKELLVLTRDRMAVVMILIAPLVMTTVMKLAFGNMNNGTDIPPIPVAVVNMDDGQIGQALVDLLKSDALDNLVDVTEAGDLEHAQSLLDDRTVDAVITTPPGLTDAIFSGAGSEATITIYGDPGRPFTAGIVRGIVQRFTQHVAAGSASVKVTFLQLIETRRVSEVTHTMKAELGERAAFMALESDLIQYNEIISGIESVKSEFNWFKFYALSMASLFILISMVTAARTLLADHELGTLTRMRSTPTSLGTIFAGKTAGMLLVGLVQTGVLMLSARFFMGMTWGDPLAVFVLTVVMVLSAAAFGLAVAGFCHSSGQLNMVGAGVVLVLGAMGGNFMPRIIYPDIIRKISLIGPNAWAIEAFQKVVLLNGNLSDIATEILVLLGLTGIFTVVAFLRIRRLVK